MLTVERLHEIKILCQKGREGRPANITAEHIADLVEAIEEMAVALVVTSAENKDLRERLRLK